MTDKVTILFKQDIEAHHPSRSSKEDFGTDLYSAKEMLVVPNMLKSTIIPTGLYVAFPEEYGMKINVRSGISHNLPLILGNSTGIVDSCFRGNVGISMRNTFFHMGTTVDYVFHLNGKRVERVPLRKLVTSTLRDAREAYQEYKDTIGDTTEIPQELFTTTVPFGTILIKQHDKIAQFHLQESVDYELVHSKGDLPESVRGSGGFGSTGSKKGKGIKQALEDLDKAERDDKTGK